MTIRMVVSLSLSILVKIRIWNVDFHLELDIRVLAVDLIEAIDKGSTFGLETASNR